MSQVYFISDLHLGHANSINWARQWREGETIEEHDQILIDKINSVVTKRDTLYVLGDVSWRENKLWMMSQIPCKKILIRGNHDDRHINEYLAYFEEVYGIKKYKGFWLTHAPVHPHELRGAKNIHGHTHNKSITLTDVDQSHYVREQLWDMWDRRYISACVECYNGYPIPFQDIIDQSYWNKKIV